MNIRKVGMVQEVAIHFRQAAQQLQISDRKITKLVLKSYEDFYFELNCHYCMYGKYQKFYHTARSVCSQTTHVKLSFSW